MNSDHARESHHAVTSSVHLSLIDDRHQPITMHAVTRLLYKEEYTVPAKGNGYVMFIVYNNGPSDVFDVHVKNTAKFAASIVRPTIIVRKGRTIFFSVSFTAKSPASPGGTDAVLVTITGKTSKATVGHVATLMVA